MNKVISEQTGKKTDARGQQEQFEEEAEAAIRRIQAGTSQVKIKSYASQKISKNYIDI